MTSEEDILKNLLDSGKNKPSSLKKDRKSDKEHRHHKHHHHHHKSSSHDHVKFDSRPPSIKVIPNRLDDYDGVKPTNPNIEFNNEEINPEESTKAPIIGIGPLAFLAKNKLILIIIAVITVLAVGVGCGFVFMSGKKKEKLKVVQVEHNRATTKQLRESEDGELSLRENELKATINKIGLEMKKIESDVGKVQARLQQLTSKVTVSATEDDEQSQTEAFGALHRAFENPDEKKQQIAALVGMYKDFGKRHAYLEQQNQAIMGELNLLRTLQLPK